MFYKNFINKSTQTNIIWSTHMRTRKDHMYYVETITKYQKTLVQQQTVNQ